MIPVDDPAESFRAIGRYFYEFSRVIAVVKRGVIESQVWHDNQALRTAQRLELQLITGEMTARPLADAFFAIPIKRTEEPELGKLDLSAEERKVLRAMQGEVNDAVTQRNDFAHGDWMIGWGGGSEETREPASLDRVKTGRRGAPRSTVQFSAASLDVLSDRLEVLKSLLAETAQLVLTYDHPALMQVPGLRLEDLFTIHADDKLVYRDGPQIASAGQYSAG